MRCGLLVLLGVAVESCRSEGGAGAGQPAATLPRTIEARLARGQVYAPCLGRLLDCVANADSVADAWSGRAAAARDLGEKIRYDLALAYRDSTVLDRVVRSLGSFADSGSTTVDDAIDLSAALLARYASVRRTPDLLHALEAALMAVEKDKRSAAAHFNAALAAREARLVFTAATEWRAYLQIDSTSGWADEARSQLADAERIGRAESQRTTDPQTLRERTLTEWLGAWADGIGSSDPRRADSVAAQIRASARTLADRNHDLTVASIARALPVRAARSATARSLAVLGADFSAAQRAYTDARYDSSRAAFARVVRSNAPPVLKEWAVLGVAASSLYLSGPAMARPVLEQIIRAAPGHLPALEGRARWLLGTALLREGHHSAAIESFARAEALFASCGEEGNAAATRYLQGEANLALGAYDESGSLLISALDTLERRPPSIWYHNTLVILTKLSGAFGLHRVESAIAGEDVRVAAALSPIYRIESALTRARLDAAAYRSDVRLADSLLGSLPAGPTREWLAAQATTLRAADTTLDASTRLSLLDSSAAFFAGRSITRWLPAVSLRASILLARGRIPDALRDLRAAHAALEGERQRLNAEGSRIRLLNQVRRIYESLAATMVANGDTLGGLHVVEETRIAPAQPVEARATQAVAEGNPQSVAVTLAMNGDTLLAWVQAGRTVTFSHWRVSRNELARLLAELARFGDLGLEERARQDWILRRLYDVLLAPVEGTLRDKRRVTFGVGGLLATVPFAALKTHDGRYLLEQWIVSVSGRARASTSSPDSEGVRSPALLIMAGNRASASSGETLDVREGDAIRRAFPSLQELRADSLEKSQLITALQGARVVHFAGHAIGDTRVPGDGFLALGAGSDGPSRQLSSGEIARLAMPRAELVVLAACESGSVVIDAESDALPLAHAFVIAGAHVVVGTLWDVDDSASGALLSAFYAALAAGDDPAAALHHAQVQMLRHQNPAFRSPAAWAGYTVTVAA